MPRGDYKKGESARLGRQIYVEKIRPLMTEDDIGAFVAIDVDTGDYEVDGDVAVALRRLRNRRPNSAVTAQRVGYRTPFSMVPRKPDDD